MMVCRAVSHRTLSFALSLAPTPSNGRRRGFETTSFVFQDLKNKAKIAIKIICVSLQNDY